MSLLLKAKQISKKFTRPQTVQIIEKADLEVRRGEAVAIMGASGQGKSTLLHILGTLEPFSSGSLEILGKVVTKRNAPSLRNAHIGFVFQSFHLLEDETTLDNVLMPARIAGKKSTQRAIALLESVEMTARASFKTALLSGGEKQRIAIARALCNDPELILADEPSGNLDRDTSKHIHELLLNLSKVQNKGVIIVTHDLELAQLCDRTLILQHGTLREQ